MAHKPVIAAIRRAAACLLALAGAAHVHAGEPVGQDLPKGWTVLSLPALRGSFLQAHSNDIALLMQNAPSGQDDQYGLAMVPDIASGKPATIVKTFIDTGPNAPRLALLPPGSYRPLCHDKPDSQESQRSNQCAPVNIATESISLCFGEASCEIIYFNGKAFRELVVTD
jgi:hypothetical protein